MATGTIIKTPKSTMISTGLTPTSNINNSESSYQIYRSGQMVTVTGYLSFTSNASGTYTSHQVYSAGLPVPMRSVECGFIVFDGGSTDVAVMSVNLNSALEIHARGVTAANKKGIFFMTYMAANEYDG